MANAQRIRFRVVAHRDDISGLGEDVLDAIRDEAYENIQIGQALVVDQVRVTLDRQASEPAGPGEPPRKIGGGLQQSWKTGRFGWRNRVKTIMQGAVESNHPAAGALEYGSPRQGIDPHPYYRPTIARIASDLEGVLLNGDAHFGKR